MHDYRCIEAVESMRMLSLDVESARVPGVVVLSGVAPAGGGEFNTESLWPFLSSFVPQLTAKMVAANIPATRIRFIGESFQFYNIDYL